MAINFTANLGLAKPTESELAKNWARVDQLCADNNAIISARMDIPVTAYTPTIIGPTTNPGVGAGEIKGEYSEFQGWVFGGFNIYFVSPGIAVGSGTGGYGIKLPTLVDNSFHSIGSAFTNTPGSFASIGEGYYSDSSTVAGSGTLVFDVIRSGGIDYLRGLTEPYGGKLVEWFGPNIPTTVADQDQWSGSFFYKKA